MTDVSLVGGEDARLPWVRPHHPTGKTHDVSHQRLTKRCAVQHAAVLHALYSHVRAAGGTATMEPRNLSKEKAIKPDLHISFPGQQILSDVVISHPLCPTHVLMSSKKQLTLAEWAARRKHNSYDNVARQHHMRMLPFSVESMGGMGTEAQKLIEQQDWRAAITCAWRRTRA
jgi:hypothetical protein